MSYRSQRGPQMFSVNVPSVFLSLTPTAREILSRNPTRHLHSDLDLQRLVFLYSPPSRRKRWRLKWCRVEDEKSHPPSSGRKRGRLLLWGLMITLRLPVSRSDWDSTGSFTSSPKGEGRLEKTVGVRYWSQLENWGTRETRLGIVVEREDDDREKE